MKVVSWRAAIHDLYIAVEVLPSLPHVFRFANVPIVVAELQKPLQSGAAVLRALPVHSVRQKHHQPALDAPFGLPRGDEIVDHNLRAVVEVAELGLPLDQVVRVEQAVAVFEAEHAELAQMRVAN